MSDVREVYPEVGMPFEELPAVDQQQILGYQRAGIDSRNSSFEAMRQVWQNPQVLQQKLGEVIVAYCEQLGVTAEEAAQVLAIEKGTGQVVWGEVDPSTLEFVPHHMVDANVGDDRFHVWESTQPLARIEPQSLLGQGDLQAKENGV